MIYMMKADRGERAIMIDAANPKQARQKLKADGYIVVGRMIRVPDFILTLHRVSPAPTGYCPNYKVDAGGELGLWLNSEHHIEFA